jgi:predicted permease
LTTVALPGVRYDTPEKAHAFFEDALARLASYPGVRAAGAANVTPLCQCNQTTSFVVVGREPFRPGEEPDVGWRVVTPGYFATLGVPIVVGRGLGVQDDRRAPRAVVVNQTLARRYFAGSAVGQRIRLGPDTTGTEIVGVVADLRHEGPARPPAPELYVAAAQFPRWELTLAVRTADPAALLPVIRATVLAVDPEQPVSDQETMRAAFTAVLGPHRLSQQLLGALAIVALALAGVGIYAVIAQLVGERTREIGIRLALGGDRAAVMALVLKQGITPAAWGLAVGAVGAVLVTRLLEAQLFGVRPGDPVTMIVVAVVLLGVALLACYAPARRATRIEPMTALRAE